MADKGKRIADDDYSSGKRKCNRKRKNPNDDHIFEDSDSQVIIDVEDSSDDEDFIEDISNSRKTCSANKGNEVNKTKRGRPRKNQTNIDSTASPACDSASPASKKRGKPKKSQSNIASTASAALDSESPASKKRGRPKKSQPNIVSPASAASDSASPATNNKGKVKLVEKKDKNTIRTRTSPTVLYKLMKKLTLGQMKDLIDMGFGSLYHMAVEDLPGRIGLFVVENLVPEEMKIKIKLKNYEIQISPDLIHEILGIPIGGMDIKNLVKNKKKEKDSLSETWYSKFSKRTPTPAEIARFIKETKIEGNIFKLSILVLFSNVMGLAGAGGQCRPQQILDYITEETKIENIDWCKYVFDCMKDSKKNWSKDNPDSYYTGPLVVLILIYIHSTKCVTDSIPHEIPAIKYWSSEKIRERDDFEFNNGGFGNLDLYKKDNNDKDSSENKLDMDKIHQNVDLLERILSEIKNEFKVSSSKNPDNPRLKELKAKFNNCIRNEYLSGEDMMDNTETENDETMGFQTENEDLDAEREKDEETGFENKNDEFWNVHLSDDDIGNNDSAEETGFEKKDVDDDYDSIGKDENENEKSDDDDLGFEKKNENENENSDVDGCNNVSKEEVYENENNTESQPTEEVFEVFETGHGSSSKDEILDTQEDKDKVDDIKAKETQELYRMQKRKQTDEDIQRRQKQRVEEIRESEKKKEENMNLKEQFRSEEIQRLTKLERRSFSLRILLIALGFNVGPGEAEIKKGYKDALLKFHPDRAPKDDIRKQVEAEETFKVIQRFWEKENKPPIFFV